MLSIPCGKLIPTWQTELRSLTLEQSTLEDALTNMSKNRVSALPVFSKGQLIGSIEVLDILAYLTDRIAAMASDRVVLSANNVISQALRLDPSLAFRADELRKTELRDRRVREIITRRTPHVLSRDAPLLDAVRLFATGVHHVYLVNPGETLPNSALSQSDVLRFLGNGASLGALGAKRLTELNLVGNRTVQVVQGSTPTIDALVQMQNKRVRFLGVVDSNWKLTTFLAASDSKALWSEHQVLGLLRPVSAVVAHVRDERAQATVSDAVTFAELLDAFSLSRSAGIFLVDAEHRPTGVATLTDLLRTLMLFSATSEVLAKSFADASALQPKAQEEHAAERRVLDERRLQLLRQRSIARRAEEDALAGTTTAFKPSQSDAAPQAQPKARSAAEEKRLALLRQVAEQRKKAEAEADALARIELEAEHAQKAVEAEKQATAAAAPADAAAPTTPRSAAAAAALKERADRLELLRKRAEERSKAEAAADAAALTELEAAKTAPKQETAKPREGVFNKPAWLEPLH